MNVICTAAAYMGIQCYYEDSSVAQVRERFQFHVAKYGLSYGTEEEFEFRFQQFLENDKKINEINARQGNTYVAGHNKFSTWTKDEFKKMLGKKEAVYNETKVVELDTSVMAAEVDWREKGAVNPVQDQGRCGSCWAFSSTAAIEGGHFIKTGELLKLSEQQFVDCEPQSYGCNGGLEIYAFEYAEKNPLELEKDYPYAGVDQKCKADESKEKIAVDDYSSVPKNDVAQLKAAIDVQPTCVSVEADTDF